MKQSERLPQTMRTLELHAYDGKPESLMVVEKPLPQLSNGAVLVRVAAAPVNPSDLAFLRGRYGVHKQLPVVPGLEGSGTVVAAGGGVVARALLGRRVACVAGNRGDGTWAEYVATSAYTCVPLLKHISDEQGAMMLVNPLSAWVLVNQARRGGHRAAVQTAAASALGRMMLRLGQRFGLPIVHVVRREEQVQLLRQLGAEYVLNSEEPAFDDRLRELCQQLGVTIGFDAVAGEMTGRLLRAMPRGGRVILYGALSNKNCQIEPGILIFQDKSVTGFWLADWSRRNGWLSQFRAALHVQRLLNDELRTEVRARLPLEKVGQALAMYTGSMTEGKVLLVPSLQPSGAEGLP